MTISPTPGPWGIEFCEHQGASTSKLYVCNPSGRIAEVYILNWYRDIDRAVANARLMAAAPETIKALEALLEMYVKLANSGDCGNWNPEDEPEVRAARRAIDKAKGV